MLMLDDMRAEFARKLAEDPSVRFSMDKALAHVLTISYQAGMDEGRKADRSSEQDAARLDWLEMNPRNAEIVVDGEIQPCLYYAVAGAFGVRLRDIIDAAMKDIGGE